MQVKILGPWLKRRLDFQTDYHCCYYCYYYYKREREGETGSQRYNVVLYGGLTRQKVIRRDWSREESLLSG